MDRQWYLNNSVVKDFIDWLDRKLDLPGVFHHHYHLVKANREWSCSCLYEAYEKYWWEYNIYCSLNSIQVKGSSFKESFKYMEDLAGTLRSAVRNGNNALAMKASLSMLAWGGVLAWNQERIEQLGSQICNYFSYVEESLDLQKVSLHFQNDIHINSGFTKLYFLLVDDYIMYDGRVGAALGLLGRLYAEEKGLATIPDPVTFSFGSGKVAEPNTLENRRNPSTKKYKLPEFSGNRVRHLTDNIKASWLLKAIADRTSSRFSLLPQDPPLNMRLTAIQSALFMVGYDVRNLGVKNKPDQKYDLEQSEVRQTYPYKTVAKGYSFRVDYDKTLETLRFAYPTKDNGKRRAPDYFSLNEVESVCLYLKEHFGDAPFPLANNVVKLTSYNEEPGLGMAIRSIPGADVSKAQASSYLGPYLAEVGVLKSVISRRTMWGLVIEVEKVIQMIREYHIKEGQQ